MSARTNSVISVHELVDKTKHMSPKEKENTAAEYFLRGSMFEAGKEVSRWVSRTEMALIYFQASAKLGNTEAMNKIGTYYSKGKGGFPMDREKALAAYTEASEKGNARAKRNIATFYARGFGGLNHDGDEAYKLLKEVIIRKYARCDTYFEP
jgi:TPR repeat protein